MVADQNSVAAQPNVPNPPWPARCPLSLALVVDQSSSMIARFPDVRKAARNVVDALRDKKSEVSLIGFGTGAEIISPAVDVSDEEARRELKDRIDALAAHEGDASATNWEAALAAARGLHPDVVILVTDGFPNVHGNPVEEGPGAVAAAAAAADLLKSDGARIAAVGVDLEQGGEENLRAISGNGVGDDYYVTGTDALLRQLYGIVADSCGVPVAALPRPEPPGFPWGRIVLGALAGLAVLTFAAFLFHRRRGTGTGPRAPARAAGATVGSRRIDHSHLAKQVRGNQSEKPNPYSTKDQP